MNTTYVGHNLAKGVGGVLIAGAGEAASGVAAEAKAGALDDILQYYFQAGGLEFDDRDKIELTDVKMAIAYVKGKKHTKAKRKAVIATAKFGLQVAATVGGATVGSVIPVAGTAIGAVGGAVAGMSLGVTVTVADQAKRKTKGLIKIILGTRGEHRKQAAQCLMVNADPQFDRADGRNAARAACIVILGEEYDKVMGSKNTQRLADRMKSN